MNWEYLRDSALVTLLEALGAALIWAIGHAVYLNRIHSHGWASTKRLLKKAGLVFSLALLTFTAVKEGRTITVLGGALLGHPRAEYLAGTLAQRGQGLLKRDQARAFAWFLKAAGQGEPDAVYALAQAYHSGQGTPRDPAQALRWAQASAQSGNPLGMVLSGELLKDRDPQAAQSYFTRSRPLLESKATAGDATACFFLGMLHWQGEGTPVDPVEALAWMLRGRSLGFSQLQSVAAEMMAQALTPDQRAQAAERARALGPSPAKSRDAPLSPP